MSFILDLYGKSVCFPQYKGVAYASVYSTIKSILSQENATNQHILDISNYFSKKSCIWGPKKYYSCENKYKGKQGALQCLIDGYDVAFITYDAYKRFSILPEFKLLQLACLNTKIQSKKDDDCFIHWFTSASLMIKNDTSSVRKDEIFNTFKSIDRLFGKQHGHSHQFRIYGSFDSYSNVLFE